MRGFLLDTNCISELVRPKPEPRVIEWMEAADEATLYLSVLTRGEIRKGLAGLAPGRKRIRLETRLEVDLQARFDGRIIPIDSAIADRWGLIAGASKRKGATLPIIDSLLAATALHHNLTLVSRNACDYAPVQSNVLNLWEV